ncbi:MAG: hypothetical protein ABR608_08345 [Pseudonocardiaceae bacterium]
MNQPSLRWVLSPLDFRMHALTDTDEEPVGFLIARCGHYLPLSVEADADPIRSGKLCTSCAALAIGPPQFGRT